MANQSSLGFLSEDGRSKAFDQRADGYARGEGVSFLVLKPLSAALRDGDAIRAVIRGTGVNQDGRTPGITVPSGESQEQLIRTVYERAGLDPSNTPFVEAHGTGTQKGDAVEARVLAKTFGHCRSSQNPVYIGSVKTNIGHLEAAAGVAQVIKTILALENAMIPPNIWFKQANPNIPLDEWHLKIPIESLKWPAGEKRRASINSFGYGGTNAHCILEAAEEFIPSMKVAKTIPHNSLTAFSGVQNTPIDVLPKLLLWSSHDKMGISRMALQYAEYLDSHVKSGANNVNLVSLLCQTLHSRRSSLPWKSYIISRTVDEMVSCFQNQVAHPLRSSKSPSLAFVFTGQGAQWPGMGCQLLCYPTFANSLRQADSFLKSTGMNGSLIGKWKYVIEWRQ
jgi:acyl transferase domain-containing protein